jgi:hypothetical protein
MGLSADEKKLLEELTAKAKEPDAEDFEIEVYDTNAGKGARLPFSKGAKWLFDTFGIGDAPAAAAGEGGGAGGDAPPAGAADQNGGRRGYFGGGQG